MFVFKLIIILVVNTKFKFNAKNVLLRYGDLFYVEYNPTKYMNNLIQQAIKETNALEVDVFYISLFSLKKYFEIL